MFLLDDCGDDRMQSIQHRPKVFLQEWAGKFHGDELVMFPAATDSDQWWFPLMIEGDRTRWEFDGALPRIQNGVPRQVKAQLQAPWMEAARPIQIRRASKIVPLEAESHLLESAEKRAPTFTDGLPGQAFCKSRQAGA